MLDKFPAIGEKNTLIVQPFGGNIYLFINEAMKIGVGVHEHELNHEGAAILKRCTGLKSIKEIIDEICVEYDDIPSAVEPKVVDFLEIAQEKGYISIQDTPIPAKGFIKGTTDYITPYKAIMEVTSACNLRCVHCYGDFGVPQEKDISTEEIFKILGTLHELGTEGLNISGGEPLMRRDIIEILDYCYDKFSFSLLSNGTLIDDDFSKKFSNYKGSPLQISLYGHTAEDHDAVTGVSGSFARTVRGIESLIRHGVYTMIAYLYVPGKMDSIKKAAELCADLGVSMFRVGSLVTTGRGGCLEWEPDYSEFRHICLILKELRKDYEGKMKVQLWDPGGEQSDEVLSIDLKEPGHLKCKIGSYAIVVGANGDLMPCGLLRLKLGNLTKEDPREVFARGTTQFFSEAYAPSDVLCGECKFLYQCRKCHAKAATHFFHVEKCPWYDQFTGAPELISSHFLEVENRYKEK